MERQQRGFSCGPAAARAALYVLGHTVTEAALRRWAKTTTYGTDESGMLRAIAHYGHKGREYQADSSKRSWGWLKQTLGRGRPVLLCVDQWDHWVTAVGRLGHQVLIFDPLPSEGRRKKYSGLEVYSEQEFISRWAYEDEESGKRTFYGISVI